MVASRGQPGRTWPNFFKRSFLLLAFVGILSNSLAFLYSHHMISSGILTEGSPHMGELMTYPPAAWLTGFLIHLGLYLTLYLANRPSSHVRLILASSVTGMSLANLFHDLTVLVQSHYLHMLATLTPAMFVVTVCAILTVAHVTGRF